MPDNEEFLSTGVKSDKCENYEGSDTTVIFFEILNVTKNQFYPFDGLRTHNDTKKFCESQGGPGTTFGINDGTVQTAGILYL